MSRCDGYNPLINPITHNPITYSPYVSDYSEALIAPGPPEFISTEDEIDITTEDGSFLITEN